LLGCHIFSIFNSMPVVVIVCIAMKLTESREYIFGMYHKDSNNFFHPLK
jgi:hypothetical protein